MSILLQSSDGQPEVQLMASDIVLLSVRP